MAKVLQATSKIFKLSARSFATQAGKPVTFEIETPYKIYTPEEAPKWTAPRQQTEATPEEVEKMFHLMSTIRRLEIVADQQYKQRMIRGFCHLYSGEEAICTGFESALTKQDYIITAYRDHGNQVARGDTPASVLAELFGRYTGCSKGKGGSLHMYHVASNFFGGNGIVGAQVPLGAGLGLAAKYLNNGAVAVAMYGDGAANQGQIFEAYNMAALWKVPVIFVLENNRYGMGTSTKRSYAGTTYYTRGQFIPGILVDGMDVFAVKEAMKHASDYCRAGNGPVVMELDAYRYSGHSMSDPGTTYRTREEVQGVRDIRDPIEKLRKKILQKGIFSEEYLKNIEKRVRDEVDAALEEAKAGQEPPVSELWKDTYPHDEVAIKGCEKDMIHVPN